VEVYPEIMIPLVGIPAELELMRALVVVRVAEEINGARRYRVRLQSGYHDRTPACLPYSPTRLLKQADFFSFGTNDLTQTTFGFSRDDAESKFLPIYLEKKILQENPFAVLDEEGMGQLDHHGSGQRAFSQ
jgi:pyruvate,orthophosphate dikinase